MSVRLFIVCSELWCWCLFVPISKERVWSLLTHWDSVEIPGKTYYFDALTLPLLRVTAVSVILLRRQTKRIQPQGYGCLCFVRRKVKNKITRCKMVNDLGKLFKLHYIFISSIFFFLLPEQTLKWKWKNIINFSVFFQCFKVKFVTPSTTFPAEKIKKIGNFHFIQRKNFVLSPNSIHQLQHSHSKFPFRRKIYSILFIWKLLSFWSEGFTG